MLPICELGSLVSKETVKIKLSAQFPKIGTNELSQYPDRI